MNIDKLPSFTSTDNRRAIQDCFEGVGCFVFRDLFAAGQIRKIRTELGVVLRNAGWIYDSSEKAPSANLDMRCADPDLAYVRTYRRALVQPAIHLLPRSSNVRALAEALGMKEFFSLPRVVLRIVFPGIIPTPPHQDWTTIKGSPNTATIWVPLMPCSLSEGPVAVLKGSHQAGEWPRRAARGIGGEIVTTDHSATWSSEEMNVGDAVVFRSLTVHCALPNTGDFMRLSLDFRIQDMREPIHPGSLLPPDRFRSWDEIYRTWSPEDRREAYYWRRRHPRLLPSVESLRAGLARSVGEEAKSLERLLSAVSG